MTCDTFHRDVLQAYAVRRGFMTKFAANESRCDPPSLLPPKFVHAHKKFTKNSQTQFSQAFHCAGRAARGILKDYVSGRLLYVTAPPGAQVDAVAAARKEAPRNKDVVLLLPAEVRMAERLAKHVTRHTSHVTRHR